MGKAIEITHMERSAAELRNLAARTRDGAVVRRLLGIAMLLDGWSRGEAATASGMDRQTLIRVSGIRSPPLFGSSGSTYGHEVAAQVQPDTIATTALPSEEGCRGT